MQLSRYCYAVYHKRAHKDCSQFAIHIYIYTVLLYASPVCFGVTLSVIMLSWRIMYEISILCVLYSERQYTNVFACVYICGYACTPGYKSYMKHAAGHFNNFIAVTSVSESLKLTTT